MNLCRPGAARKRGQAGWRRLQIAYAAKKRPGNCSRRHRCFRKNANPTRPSGKQGSVAPQEEKNGMVAVERPQETAPISARLFARRRIWRFYGDLDPNPVRGCRRRDSRSRPGSTENYKHEAGRGEVETTLKKSCQCTTLGAEARWSFRRRWGLGARISYSRDQRSEGGTPL